MLRVVSHKSAAAAMRYYTDGLKREDYYSEGQEIVGKWHGRAAKHLGLSGNVKPDEFAALVGNRHPHTGQQLTPNTKRTRIVGYDLNFHAPKSLSLLYAITGDQALLRAFRKAVAESMSEIEEQTETRIRKGGAQADRVTGNLAWAEFIHLTARPVDGIPDPHLHVHCFAFNATYDQVENEWKAAKFRDIKKNAPYSQAIFHSRLTAELTELGYKIERTAENWEIAGVPDSAIRKFSRRTAQIEELAQKKGITDPKAKDALGAKSRESKRHGLTYADLLAKWGERLTPAEKAQIAKTHDRGHRNAERITPTEALDYACEKMFAKESVVSRNRLLAEAMRFSFGHCPPEKIRAAFERRGMIVKKVGDDLLCTSVDVLAEELALINFVRNGRSKFAPLATSKSLLLPEYLSNEQKAAAKHILQSRDQVIGIRGAAGVGKTTALKEVIPLIEATGKKVFVFAPSAKASRGTLREEGFANAQTVAHLLFNPKLQERIKGQVIWIDEIGLLGVRDTWRLLEIAGKDARVILTGDHKQHLPVPRGDAFRQLQEYAGLKVAEITEIRRQSRSEYKEAVAALAMGNLRRAFRKLDEMGAIIEIKDEKERYARLAADYMTLGRKGRPPLVVSPTHAEADKVTEAIRGAKRDAGRLTQEREFTQYHNLQWEKPDRALPENYRSGMAVKFHQNAKGFVRGELVKVIGVDKSRAVQVERGDGRKAVLSVKDAERFAVFETRKIKLGKGDQIRITSNGQTADGRKIHNGDSFRIDRITKKGEIVLHTGGILKPDHGHIAYGYCQTSYSSQSRSVRDVLIAQKGDSGLAASLNQFYVSVSRAKESIRILTDDRRALQQSVGNFTKRMAGVELAGISKKEINSMSPEMGAQEWKSWVQGRRRALESKSFVEHLQRQRRQNGLKKPDGMNWAGYVKMRRAMVSQDGKNRSKGYPSQSSKKKSSVIRGGTATSFNDKVFNKSKEAEKPAKAAEQKSQTKAKATKLDRFKSNLKASKANFKKVLNRAPEKKPTQRPEQQKPKPVKKQPVLKPAKNDALRVAKRQTRQRRVQNIQKPKVKAKTPAPPPPRRGK